MWEEPLEHFADSVETALRHAQRLPAFAPRLVTDTLAQANLQT